MEQQILVEQKSQTGDVKLTLVSTQSPARSQVSAFRSGSARARGAATGALACSEWDGAETSAAYLAVKRTLDIVISAIALTIAFLPLLLIALCIQIESIGPVLHRRRVLAWQAWNEALGPNRLRMFDAYNLRTMIADADDYLTRNPKLFERFQQDWKLEDDPRITKIGAKLRATSIDEFPQLINVLKGQMSIVGPRMITAPELDRYGRNAARLLSVKPGLTGLWQVSGRQELSYAERVRLDMSYIEARSFALDFQILLRTVVCVLQRKGAY